MCGICGFNWNDKILLKNMMKSMYNRGPDQKGIFEDSTMSLGHMRLSIIDLSKKGIQPMCNEDETIWIVFNGEIYNFQELKSKLNKKHKFKSNTDTEVIIHLYEEVGKNFVKYLNGDFAIFIYDSKKKKGFLARDRFGIKQAYYYLEKGKFIFGSEIKAILEWKEFDKKLNMKSISDYLIYSFSAADRTIVDKIRKVMPSEIIEINLKTLKMKNEMYYTPTYKDKNVGYNVSLRKLENLLEDCIKRRMIADVPVGAYLSGGLDSSTISYFMSKYNKNLKTFSVQFDSEDVKNETYYSQMVSQKINSEHKNILVSIDSIKILPKIIYCLDEPISNISAIPLYFLSKEARKSVKVILNGNGGDEVFAGYRHYKILNITSKLNFMKGIGRISGLIPFLNKNRYSIFLQEICKAKNYEETFKAIVYKNFTDKERVSLFNGFKDNHAIKPFLDIKASMIKRAQITDLRNLLPNNLLVVDDRMSMANSLESRVPFLDHRLVNLSMSMPDNYKMILGGKRILRDLMKIHLPKPIVKRQKYGFTVPLKHWFEYLKEDAYERLKQSKVFNRDEIEKLFIGINNHKINKIWQIYCLQLWNDIFIEGKKILNL